MLTKEHLEYYNSNQHIVNLYINLLRRKEIDINQVPIEIRKLIVEKLQKLNRAS